MIAAFRGAVPVVDATAWVAPDAVVIGDVVLGPGSSLWFKAVVRGDVRPIRIGARTNVQDHTTIHVSSMGLGTTLGDDVTIGHAVVLHACIIGDRVLVGMGAVVLDGAEVGSDCFVAAGSLVSPGARVPAGHLVMGRPARVVRALTTNERAHVRASAERYVAHAAEYRAAGIG